MAPVPGATDAIPNLPLCFAVGDGGDVPDYFVSGDDGAVGVRVCS